MVAPNQTVVTEFILQSFTENPRLQALFFSLFLLLFVMAFVGNVLIIAAIQVSTGLHVPMYFFLANLAILDIICTLSILPKVLQNLIAVKKTISYGGCMNQLFFFSWSLSSELVLFMAMAYDRYMAICQPLHYSKMMSKTVCVGLAAFVWSVGGLISVLLTGLVLSLSFCGPNFIPHFFCEIPPILLLSCTPTYWTSIVTITADMLLAGLNFFLTMVSYGFIIASIMKIRTSEGKKRAFSTCSSHLIVVTLFYSTVIYSYIRPVLGTLGFLDKLVSVLYTVLTPTLNPLIYTLRNKDVKVALKKLFTFPPP
ncbi:olfactory receptor 13A1-like [Tachyglossus aculeatus]|uniref:olfactory receptor 13A1-like n=1 Tax=Tachyglossus aculeatus TaxID=9261 RepID=UPI0018F65950|nr:olfactory receptor 13A1-like [Tachyglossus aculeatus]